MDWIGKYRVQSGGNIINLLSNQRYAIDDGDLPKFWQSLCTLVYNGERHHYAQISGETSPVLARIRLEYDTEVEVGVPTNFVKALIYAYQDVLERRLMIPNDRLVAVATTACSHTKMKLFYCNIMFPFAIVNSNQQKNILMQDWRKRLNELNPIQYLEKQNLGEYVDFSFPGNHWLLFGGVPLNYDMKFDIDAIYPRLEYHEVYDSEPVTISLDDIFRPEECELVKQDLASVDAFKNNEPDFWLPYFLSLKYFSKLSPIKKFDTLLSEQESQFTEFNPTGDGLDEIRELCRLIPWSWRKNPVFSNKIGSICWRCSKGANEGFELWRQIVTEEQFNGAVSTGDKSDRSDTESVFSKISEDTLSVGGDESSESGESTILHSRDPIEYQGLELETSNEEEKMWNSFQNRKDEHYTTKTLRFMAYRLSNNAYRLWLHRRTIGFLDSALTALDYHVANLFYEHYPYAFIWCSGGWRYFDEHRWHQDKEGIHLSKYLSGPFVDRLKAIVEILKTENEQELDNISRKLRESVIDKIGTLIDHLYIGSFKDKVIKQLKIFYVFEEFHEIHDENVNLLVFNNTVLEICGKEIISRIGLPEDYCTFSTKIKYLDRINPVREKKVMKYMQQIFPNREKRIWFMMWLTSSLKGGCDDKVFTFNQGSGDNAKSGVSHLIHLGFGDYAIEGDNRSILANVRKNATGAEPEKIRNRGRRHVMYLEVDGSEPLSGGAVRKLSGGDKQGGARDLYQGASTMIDVKQTFKCSLWCNKLPSFSEGAINATFRRIKVIHYTSKWSENAPEDVEEQWKTGVFPLDNTFYDNHLPDLAETFMAILVRLWGRYYEQKLQKCEEIEHASMKYREKVDIFFNYLNERTTTHCLENKVLDRSYKISIPKLYQDFISWFVTNFPSSSAKKPSRTEFQAEMENKGLVFEINNYIGVSIKSVVKDLPTDDE